MNIDAKNGWLGWSVMILIALLAAQTGIGAEDEHAHEDEGGHEEEAHEDEGLRLTRAEQVKAGIETAELSIKPVNRRLRVPGEVQANAYQSAKIAPRITA